MKIKSYLLVMFFICTMSVNAQGSHLGLRFEFYGYGTTESMFDGKSNSNFNILHYPSFYFFYSRDIYKDFSFAVKPGIIISDDDLKSVELGSYCRYELGSNNLYLQGGFNVLFSTKIIGGNYSANTAPRIYFVNAGAGYKVAKHLNLDLIYYQPLNRELEDIGPINDIFSRNIGIKKINNVIKFSLEFYY